MDTKLLYINLGNLIREARTKAGINQSELATQVGLSRTSITNIEIGQQKVQLHTLYEISKVLNISLTKLLPKQENTQLQVLEEEIDTQTIISKEGKAFEQLSEEEKELILDLKKVIK